jgi:hypothetical protein
LTQSDSDISKPTSPAWMWGKVGNCGDFKFGALPILG